MKPFQVLVAVVLAAFLAGCSPIARHPATGTVAGQAVDTTVDSEDAVRYLQDPACRPDEQADPYDRESLQLLSERRSVDFAAAWFAEALYRMPANGQAQDAFHDAVQAAAGPDDHRNWLLVFVPGYGYRRNPETGADFARPREILQERGYRTLLIQTDELGTVEENAGIVSERLRELAADESQVVMISTSKGGPEVALALGELLPAEESAHVRAWISVGGLLRGSPQADRALRWPRRWFARTVLWFKGLRPGIIENLSTPVRRPVFDRLRWPPHVLMVQYVGVPLSGQVGRKVRGRYRKMRHLGPNDGLTLLADELVPGGIVVTDVGLDHYYRDPDIDLKTIALVNIVLEELDP